MSDAERRVRPGDDRGVSARRGRGRSLSRYAEEVVFEPLVAGPYHGRDGVVEQMSVWVEEFDGYWFESEELFDADEKVVLVWRHGGRGRTSGIDTEDEGATVFTVGDGLIVMPGCTPTAPRPSRPPDWRGRDPDRVRADVEIVRAMCDAYCSGDYPSALDLLDPEASATAEVRLRSAG